MSVKKDILFRFGIIYFIVLTVSVTIVAKVIYVQFAEGAELKKMMDKISLKDIIIEPNRGDILATDSRILATSVPYYEIRMDTKATGLTNEIFNNKIDSLARSLARVSRKKRCHKV